MDKEYCRHCGCLTAGDGDEWLCGSHSDDPISAFSECPESEKDSEIIEKISHGYVVQKVDALTNKCIEQDFHVIESYWEDNNGNTIEPTPEIQDEIRPIIIKEPVYE